MVLTKLSYISFDKEERKLTIELYEMTFVYVSDHDTEFY